MPTRTGHGSQAAQSVWLEAAVNRAYASQAPYKLTGKVTAANMRITTLAHNCGAQKQSLPPIAYPKYAAIAKVRATSSPEGFVGAVVEPLLQAPSMIAVRLATNRRVKVGCVRNS